MIPDGAGVVPPESIVYDWRVLTQRIGGRVRQCRLLLGLSQDQLGRLAQVSQGAVSRVESGRCSATPLITYVKVFSALVHEIGGLRLDGLGAELLEFMASIRQLTPGLWLTEAPLLRDVQLEQLLAAYTMLGAEGRQTFVRLVVPIASLVAEGKGGT